MIRVLVGSLSEQVVEGVVRPVQSDFSSVSHASRDLGIAAGEAIEEKLRRVGSLPMGGAVILEAWPVYAYLNSRVQDGTAEVGATSLLFGVSGAAILTILATWLPLRAGIQKIQSVEF